MTVLLENPLPALVFGGLGALMAGIVFMARRSAGSLVAMVLILLATLGLVIFERLVETDREQILASVYDAMDAVEQNDLDGVLARIDPSAAKIRADAAALMPLIDVETANATGTVRVELEPLNPSRAVSQFKGFVNGVAAVGGMRLSFFDDVEIFWAKRDDKWLIVDYVAYWNGQPLSAVDSARSNRPIRGN